MFTLQNDNLQIDILDPVADAFRLGPRFCWGGYIWQVHDRQLGPLLAGPEWPALDPIPFNGQGLPESFRHRTRDGKPLTWSETGGVAIGAGALRVDETGGVTVAHPCDWTITRFDHHVVFITHHAFADFNYFLTRRIELDHRTVRSVTELTNPGPSMLQLQWFAHPFFALTAGKASMIFPSGSSLAENPGFALAGNLLTFKRSFVGKDDGQFTLLGLPPQLPLLGVLNHPILRCVEFSTDFVPSECPVWANGNTLSVEPYLTLELASGQKRSWSVQYRFVP